MNAKTKPTCPGCNQSDQVKKLSVFYAESLVNSSDKNKTEKSAPPVKPKFNGLLEKYLAASQKLVNQTESHIGCLSALLVYFITLAVPIMLWFIIVILISLAIVGAPIDMESPVPQDGLFISVFSTLLILPLAVLIYFSWRKRKRFNQAHMPSWIASLEEWSKQYYCIDCDLKFIPASLISSEPVTINWERLAIKEEEDKIEFEKAMLPFLGTARNDQCQECSKKIKGIYFSSGDYKNMRIAALQKLKTEAISCPECNAVYCAKCKNKSLGINFMDGSSKASCPKCKAAIREQNVLVGMTGWYDTLPKLSDIEDLKKAADK